MVFIKLFIEIYYMKFGRRKLKGKKNGNSSQTNKKNIDISNKDNHSVEEKGEKGEKKSQTQFYVYLNSLERKLWPPFK